MADEESPEEPLRYPDMGGIPGKRLSAPPMELDGAKGEFMDGRKRRSMIYRFPGTSVYVGWKAIAQGLGVSTSTARRYHELYGMPVVRLIGRRPITTQGAIDDWVTRLAGIERGFIKKIRDSETGEPWMDLPRRWRMLVEKEQHEQLGRRRDRGDHPEDDSCSGNGAA